MFPFLPVHERPGPGLEVRACCNPQSSVIGTFFGPDADPCPAVLAGGHCEVAPALQHMEVAIRLPHPECAVAGRASRLEEGRPGLGNGSSGRSRKGGAVRMAIQLGRTDLRVSRLGSGGH